MKWRRQQEVRLTVGTGGVTASRLKATCSYHWIYHQKIWFKVFASQVSTSFAVKQLVEEAILKKKYFWKVHKDMLHCHQHFTAAQSGIIFNSAYPAMGASPDGVIHYSCCPNGCLEVKCSCIMETV